MTTTVGSLFSGYGGLDMAVEAVLGGELAWVSDIDKGACKILAHHWPDVPNLGDISAANWLAVPEVDVITGGFPCQDVSHAGKRAGLGEGTRTGLWSYMATAIDVLRPRLVVAENVRGLLSADAASDVEPCPWCLGDGAGESPLRALGAVLADLADVGYDARWVGLRAADVGAPHGRFRVFVVAYPASDPRRLGNRGQVRPELGDGAAAFADGLGGERGGRARGWGPGSADDGGDVADSEGDGWDEGWTEPAWLERGSDAAECGPAHPDTAFERRRAARGYDGVRAAGLEPSGIAWGDYEPAVRRWERVSSRVAPSPTELGAKGGRRLSPRFVEWMMGLPAGHVTDVPG